MDNRDVPAKEAIRTTLEKRHEGGHTVSQLEEETTYREARVPERHHLRPSWGVEVRGVRAAACDVEPNVARRPPEVTDLHCQGAGGPTMFLGVVTSSERARSGTSPNRRFP